MYNPTQPYINFANANMAALSHLMQSAGQAGAIKANADTLQAKGFFGQAPQSEALSEWTTTTMNNYASFVRELNESFFGMARQAKDLVAEQTEELSKKFKQKS